jgi:hypothetical protein
MSDLTPEERRAKGYLSDEDIDLAEELGVRFAVRCVCGHVLVTSDRPIKTPQILPCCESGECPYCAAGKCYHREAEEALA